MAVTVGVPLMYMPDEDSKLSVIFTLYAGALPVFLIVMVYVTLSPDWSPVLGLAVLVMTSCGSLVTMEQFDYLVNICMTVLL